MFVRPRHSIVSIIASLAKIAHVEVLVIFALMIDFSSFLALGAKRLEITNELKYMDVVCDINIDNNGAFTGVVVVLIFNGDNENRTSWIPFGNNAGSVKRRRQAKILRLSMFNIQKNIPSFYYAIVRPYLTLSDHFREFDEIDCAQQYIRIRSIQSTRTGVKLPDRALAAGMEEAEVLEEYPDNAVDGTALENDSEPIRKMVRIIPGYIIWMLMKLEIYLSHTFFLMLSPEKLRSI
ncbi:hypothetical protein BDB01DRAFT_863119 [Pilobolus umbonatus]|nr:hypothetical protein BDB01DRAFT_863119 [Pilobolus umbonatus]